MGQAPHTPAYRDDIQHQYSVILCRRALETAGRQQGGAAVLAAGGGHGLTYPPPARAAQRLYCGRRLTGVGLFLPPDGYGCRCRIRAFTKAQVEARGFAVHEPELYDIEQEYGIPGQTRTVKAMKIGGETYTADPGFGFNPGKVAFTPTLDKYATQAARQYITGSLTGPDFARGLAQALAGDASPQQTYPVAMLDGAPDSLRTVSVAQTAMPELSADTAGFVTAQQTIENPAHVVTADDMTWYARQADNVWQVAGVRERQLTALKQGDNLSELLPEGVNVPDNH